LSFTRERALTKPMLISLSGSHTRAVERGGLNTSQMLSAYTPTLL
jgi:hypothetical protein